MIVKSPSADISWTKGAKRLMANVDRFREMMMEFTQNQQVNSYMLFSVNVHVQLTHNDIQRF